MQLINSVPLLFSIWLPNTPTLGEIMVNFPTLSLIDCCFSNYGWWATLILLRSLKASACCCYHRNPDGIFISWFCIILFNPMPLWHSPILHDITDSTTLTDWQYKSQYKFIKDNPHTSWVSCGRSFGIISVEIFVTALHCIYKMIGHFLIWFPQCASAMNFTIYMNNDKIHAT